MTKTTNELRSLKKLSIILFSIVVIVVFFLLGGVFLIFRPIWIEESCTKRAREITGDKANILVKPNEEDLRKSPGLMKNSDQITLYYREFLKCISE